MKTPQHFLALLSGMSIHQTTWKLCECVVTVFILQKKSLTSFKRISFCGFCYCFASQSVPQCLSAIRSVDVKLCGAPVRLHFRGTRALLIKAFRWVQAFSPSASSWWSQKSLTTTNISAATACFSVISFWEDIFRVSQPLWRHEKQSPSLHPISFSCTISFQTTVQRALFTLAHCCHTVRCCWLLRVSLTIFLLHSPSSIGSCSAWTYSLMDTTESFF